MNITITQEAAFLLKVARQQIVNGVTACPVEAIDMAGQVWNCSAAAEILALNTIAAHTNTEACTADVLRQAAIMIEAVA